MAGKTESEKARAVRDIERMNFTDHDDFISYVTEVTGGESSDSVVKPATDAEMDEAMSYLFPGQTNYVKPYVPKAGEASQVEIDDIFKN
jgi:hypothetical protein